MQKKIKPFLYLLIWISASFSGGAQINKQFEPVPSSYGIKLSNPMHALSINYDTIDAKKQRFHLFLPDTTKNYPLIIYIHGGGFTGGSPDKVLANGKGTSDLRYCIENGYAYASIGYRLINSHTKGEKDTIGVIKCLNDSKRALQFIRYHADELKIIPERIALVGSSAGAGTSLWLAARSNMADSDATDPVKRESTRVRAAVLNGTQATYDLNKWETIVFKNYDKKGSTVTLEEIEAGLTYQRGSNFYGGYDSLQQLLTEPHFIQYRQDVDMLYHISSDDPPIYISSTAMQVSPYQNILHHGLHGKAVLDAALAVNLTGVKANIPLYSINTTKGESPMDFLMRHLNNSIPSSGIMMREHLGIEIFPNPANSQITIKTGNNVLLSDVEIFSIQGRSVLRKTHINSNKATLKLTDLHAGIYIVRTTSDQGATWNKKLRIE